MTAASFAGLLHIACGTGPLVIDARDDAGARDAGASPTDGGGMDAAMMMMDAGVESDAGCMPAPPLPDWVPVDTGGPSGESVSACLARLGSDTDDRRPVDQAYDLTTFGGPGDEQPVACPGTADADGTWYYAANSQRYACGQKVRLVNEARTSCVIVEVADLGPNSCVEEAGQMPIWDVSPLAANALFGVSSVGWSEHRQVRGAPVDNRNALGPCTLGGSGSFLAGFVGGPCTSAADCRYTGATCLTGLPGGACSLDCTTSCPDATGSVAYTACVDVGAARQCMARCDFTLFAAGCRDGYACERRPHPTGAGEDRWVCLSAACE